ncbi:MAG TPA: hypothetical protein VIU61_19780 [Kofleriaceae bacterium]
MMDLRAALEAAIRADDGTPARRRNRIEATRHLIVALVDDLDDEAADQLIATLGPLVRDDPRLEIELRRELALDLASVRDQGRAVSQLSIALDRARECGLDDDELDLGTELARLLRASSHNLDAEAVLANTTERVSSRREHAAAVERAEELLEADRVDEARALLEALPPADDNRESRALLEEIQRRGGEPEGEVEPVETEPGLALALNGRLRAFVTRPRNLAQGILDGGLLGEDKILELSHGTIDQVADLESQVVFGPVRTYHCACGRYRGRAYAGLVCRRCRVEVTSSSSRRVRAAHLQLPIRVMHPWYEAAAAQLLGFLAVEMETMDPDALATRLDALDLDALARDLKHTIVTAASTKVADQAGRRHALVEAFRNARQAHRTSPVSITMQVLPVLPPEAELDLDRARVRAAYARIIEASPDTVQAAVDGLFAAFAG